MKPISEQLSLALDVPPAGNLSARDGRLSGSDLAEGRLVGLRELSEPKWQTLASGAILGRGLMEIDGELLLRHLNQAFESSPPRRFQIASGAYMGARSTNLGARGWYADEKGYRYVAKDPLSDAPWPNIPTLFLERLAELAKELKFPHFSPDSCLCNQYAPGDTMGLHRDLDERDLSQPIFSVSYGLSAIFQLGGVDRKDKVQKIELHHGDVLVLSGLSRRFFHGVSKIFDGEHPVLGRRRINLSFRCS